MIPLVYTVHIIVCFSLIIIVLLQAGKGADMGAAFGGASKTVFGPRGAAGPLAKVTVVAAVLFMLTNVFLAWAKPGQGDLIKNVPSATTTAPTAPTSPVEPPSGRTITIPVGNEGGTINLGGQQPAPGAAPVTIPITPPTAPAPGGEPAPITIPAPAPTTPAPAPINP